MVWQEINLLPSINSWDVTAGKVRLDFLWMDGWLGVSRNLTNDFVKWNPWHIAAKEKAPLNFIVRAKKLSLWLPPSTLEWQILGRSALKEKFMWCHEALAGVRIEVKRPLLSCAASSPSNKLQFLLETTSPHTLALASKRYVNPPASHGVLRTKLGARQYTGKRWKPELISLQIRVLDKTSIGSLSPVRSTEEPVTP